VGLRLPEAERAAVDALEPDLRAAAEAIGGSLRGRLTTLRPGLLRPPAGGAGPGEAGAGPPDALLDALELDREGLPDALSLAACLAAHRAYVAARGEAEGVSIGALALARLLVWASRAALLGPAPRVAWIGPAPRQPEAQPGQFALGARCAVTVEGRVREARAVALVAR
jgi:hypothetical protein